VELRQDLARRDLALNLFSLTFGGIAALAEIGSGTLFTPYFRAAGMEPKLAIGTSAVIGLPVSPGRRRFLRGRAVTCRSATGCSATSTFPRSSLWLQEPC
jgi:uncharacterized membrane protein YfcA